MSQWQKILPKPTKIVIWGAADQGRVNYPILKDLGCDIVALIDDTPGMISPYSDVPLFFGWSAFSIWIAEKDIIDIGFVIAIGNPYGHVRCKLQSQMQGIGLKPVSFADRTALISSSSSYGDGLQVMPQALVHNDVIIHDQCIINTKALVEHDCELESGVEIGPGAVLCGRVHVGANTWIGAGATIRPRVNIGKNSIVGAGSVVVNDIEDDVVVAGVPAKVLQNRKPYSSR